MWGKKSITVDGITITAKKGKLKPAVIKLAKSQLKKSNRTEYEYEKNKRSAKQVEEDDGYDPSFWY